MSLLIALTVSLAFAQIDTSVIERYRAALEKQASGPETKRQGGTQPQDWIYRLPDGVATREVTFYSDGAACHAKLFFPKGYPGGRKWPAVVLGHGFNAISIGIEKYGARFAERGLVAMVIDYRTYGFSSGQVFLLEEDTSSDARPITGKQARIRLKRTRLNAFRQLEDYRAAISFLQGENGVDRERIGAWGSSHSGGLVVTLAGLDARVKAVVSQVIGVGGRNLTGPPAWTPGQLQDAILRARTGQGGEVDGGFSFRTKIDVETSQTGREHRPWSALPRIPDTTAILWIPAGKDELAPPRSASGPYEAAKVFRGVSQVAEIPFITHFQAYSGAAFEVSSTLAADWFLNYLGKAAPVAASALRTPVPPLPARATAAPARLPEGVTVRETAFYSEGVKCFGKLFLPAGFNTASNLRAVVLAPDWGLTHASLEAQAGEFAARGITAMAIDYRGWGKSGGYLYTTDRVHTDDRFRFLELTTNVRVVRKRLMPQHQVEDIRNAISYLAGEPGVDAARIGLWGVGMAGAHAAAIAAIDPRLKAALAVNPFRGGKDLPAKAQAPTGTLADDAVRMARTGLLPATATSLALLDYLPFQTFDQIPKTVAFVILDAPATSAEWFEKHL
ncbi:MAG: acetylxylan esterase [Candidatus Solibacter usitatus]|nr:acetylxylan esterase [Candidatus Solibacter usitatus]